MFADLERYKSLERDYLIASTVNQFSGLVYVPDLTYLSFQDDLQAAGAVTINVDNATCTLQEGNSYPAYFIPGYLAEVGKLANNFTGIEVGATTFLDLFSKEVLVTHINANYWYPNNYPDASWGRLRQSPFQQSFCFHIGSSKTYAATGDYYQYTESGLFLLNMVEVYKLVTNTFNNNVNVRVTSSSMTYQPYTASGSGIQSLSKNTIINYVKRFTNTLI
ncbi:hypothetical protein [Nodularia sphaerocarpa]|uniref:hypothetical protein n=1 Tax=Nodularia sphaerocarpa TaxID=137816 RepID=UPI001EFA86F1|nr:hypothetical protein [Nodularia sphaerocarpa]MDB9372381.1 hypothetical protein [Nodularia sphaerocarpa CS-585]ULP71462.1 hypothetical protein BDGGKGIB_01088 [Nodularia sphaerocarpa UHCC 0038]ULP73410.1 hypothetical protein BDGGKGIB_03063 [Nodularia sphaerocarpa UHCC 0038]